MKKNKKLLKIMGGVIGIAAIACIIPACVVSCGSSSNSSSSSNQPTLPTSLADSSVSSVASNWNNAYNAYEGGNNYGSWMKSNVENYVKNAPSYFNDLTTTYAKLTNTNTSIKGTALHVPTNSNTGSTPPTIPSSMLDSNTNSSPTNTQSTKTYDLSGYLPFTTSMDFSMGSVNAFSALMTNWFKLTSETVSNWSENNNQFSFDLTQNYDVYSEINMSNQTPQFSETTFSVTQTITNATFASTILTSLSNSLNSNNKQTMVNAGWYMSKCASDVYSSSDFASLQKGISTMQDMMGEFGSPMLATTINSTQSSVNTINGSTSFSNPSTSSQINSPLTTDFYYTFASFMANTTSTTLKSNKEFSVKDNWSSIENSGWLGSFTMNGIAGYALNDSQNITSSSVNNPNVPLIDVLKNPTQFAINATISTSGIGGNIPMPSPTPSPMPTPNPTPTKTTPVSSTSLPTSLTGSTFADQDANWVQAWTKEMENSNFSSWMENNIANYASNAPTYFSDLANQYDTLTNTATSVTVTPLSIPNVSGLVAGNTDPMPTISPTPKTYDITGYLPFTSQTISSMGTTSSTTTTIYWFKLDSETISSITTSNDTFSFTLTQNYSEYTEMEEAGLPMSMTPNSLTITQSVEGATFAPTLLAPLASSLSSASTITAQAGWYMEKCTSDTFSSTDATTVLGLESLTGKTSFANPSSTSYINSPVTSDFYNNYAFYPSIIASEESSTMKIIDNASTLKTNPWLQSVATTGIAGYALNGKNEIKGNSISYDSSSIISSLKTNKIEYTQTETINTSGGDIHNGVIPTGTSGSASGNTIPSGITGTGSDSMPGETTGQTNGETTPNTTATSNQTQSTTKTTTDESK